MNLFYELIQIALGTRKEFSVIPSLSDWEIMFVEAEKQSILGIAFSGIEKAVKHYGEISNIGIDSDLFAEWYNNVQKIEERNKELNNKSVWLQSFLARNGMDSCILKGQGNALLYPEPLRRTCGDIDVWVWFNNHDERCDISGKESRKLVIDWVKNKMCDRKIDIVYHHVQLPALGEIEVEAHFWPTFFFSFIKLKRLESWCEYQRKYQMYNLKELPDGEGKISVPTYEFNLVFQLIHIMRHIFAEGIGLRQLVDYYWTLDNSSSFINKDEVTETIKNFGIESFAGGVMWIMKEIFGMDEDKLLFPPQKNVGSLIIKDIERGGNFGHGDTYAGWRDNSKLQMFVWRTWRSFKVFQICPSEVFWAPFFRIYQWLWIKKVSK